MGRLMLWISVLISVVCFVVTAEPRQGRNFPNQNNQNQQNEFPPVQQILFDIRSDSQKLSELLGSIPRTYPRIQTPLQNLFQQQNQAQNLRELFMVQKQTAQGPVRLNKWAQQLSADSATLQQMWVGGRQQRVQLNQVQQQFGGVHGAFKKTMASAYLIEALLAQGYGNANGNMPIAVRGGNVQETMALVHYQANRLFREVHTLSMHPQFAQVAQGVPDAGQWENNVKDTFFVQYTPEQFIQQIVPQGLPIQNFMGALVPPPGFAQPGIQGQQPGVVPLVPGNGMQGQQGLPFQQQQPQGQFPQQQQPVLPQMQQPFGPALPQQGQGPQQQLPQQPGAVPLIPQQQQPQQPQPSNPIFAPAFPGFGNNNGNGMQIPLPPGFPQNFPAPPGGWPSWMFPGQQQNPQQQPAGPQGQFQQPVNPQAQVQPQQPGVVPLQPGQLPGGQVPQQQPGINLQQLGQQLAQIEALLRQPQYRGNTRLLQQYFEIQQILKNAAAVQPQQPGAIAPPGGNPGTGGALSPNFPDENSQGAVNPGVVPQNPGAGQINPGLGVAPQGQEPEFIQNNPNLQKAIRKIQYLIDMPEVAQNPKLRNALQELLQELRPGLPPLQPPPPVSSPAAKPGKGNPYGKPDDNSYMVRQRGVVTKNAPVADKAGPRR